MPTVMGQRGEAPTATRGSQRVPVASPLAGQVVLCIDNEPEILEAMDRLLAKWGAVPVTASTIDAAIQALAARKSDGGRTPAMLLVDYHLDDGATGIDAVRAVREEIGQVVPVIVVTADHTDGVADAVREEGLRLLHKPLKPAALRALMTSLLSRRDVA